MRIVGRRVGKGAGRNSQAASRRRWEKAGRVHRPSARQKSLCAAEACGGVG